MAKNAKEMQTKLGLFGFHAAVLVALTMECLFKDSTAIHLLKQVLQATVQFR